MKDGHTGVTYGEDWRDPLYVKEPAVNDDDKYDDIDDDDIDDDNENKNKHRNGN